VSVYNLTTKKNEIWGYENKNGTARKWKDKYPECVYHAEGWGY